MTIVWINDEASFAGGAETYIYQTAQRLLRTYGVENILLYDVNKRVDPKFTQPFSFVTVIADLKKQIEQMKPDIIYVHQVGNTKIFDTLNTLGIPLVGFIHDHKYFCPREHKYTALTHTTCTKSIGLGCYGCMGFINKSAAFPYISVKTVGNLKSVHKSLQRFDHIVVASEYMKTHLKQHGFNESKLTKNPLFSENSVESSAASCDSKNEKRFLFVGQLIRGKGLDTLLNAFAKLKSQNFYLDICGDGKQRRELEEQVQNLGLSHKVLFHGKQSQENLVNYYNRAYAVVIPSRAPETFNLVGIEAMKYAKATIAADVGGIREWLKDKETGLTFPSNDSQSLADALRFALENPKKIEEMGLKGLESYNNKFLPEYHCSRLYGLFTSFTIKESYAI